jgi:LemA protein
MEWVIPAVLAIILAWASWIHARLRRLRREAVNAWPPLATLLQRRHGLVGALVQALQDLPRRAQKPVQALGRARQAALMADLSPLAASRAERALETAIANALAEAEAHPDRVDAARLRQIAGALEALAADIAAAAEAFNREVFAYNMACVGVPAILLVKLMNIWKLEYFGLDEEDLDALSEIERGHAPAPGASRG